MSPEDRHVVWEYKVHPLDSGVSPHGPAASESLAETMQTASAEGWEMVTTLTVETSTAATHTLALFKRRAS